MRKIGTAIIPEWTEADVFWTGRGGDMRGTVAKRLRKRTKGVATSDAYADKVFADFWRKKGCTDKEIERKYYKKCKRLYKLWKRFPDMIGGFF